MINLITLRNIITFFAVLFFVACSKANDDHVRTLASSEDKDYVNVVDVISDPESGKQIYIVVKK